MSMSSRPTGTTRAVVTDEVDDRRSALRVARGRDDAERLVEQDVGQLLLADRLAVDLDDVPRGDEGVQLAALAVDRDAARLDQLVGGPAGRDAGAREVAVESHPVIVATLSRGARLRRLTRRLADLIVGFGANVQPGSARRRHELPRQGGADPRDRPRRLRARRPLRRRPLLPISWVKRERLLHGDPDTFSYIPPWMTDRVRHFSDEHAARISLSGPHAPHALDGVAAERSGRDLLPYLPEIGEIVNERTTNWCVAPAPTRDWAEVVYPEPSPDEAFDRLWEAIAHVCRLDEDDPVAAWTERMATVKRSATALTERRLRRDPPPRAGHRPDGRPLPVVALARGRVHDRRRPARTSRTSRARRRSRRPIRCASTATSARRCRSSSTARSSAASGSSSKAAGP